MKNKAQKQGDRLPKPITLFQPVDKPASGLCLKRVCLQVERSGGFTEALFFANSGALLFLFCTLDQGDLFALFLHCTGGHMLDCA